MGPSLFNYITPKKQSQIKDFCSISYNESN